MSIKTISPREKRVGSQRPSAGTPEWVVRPDEPTLHSTLLPQKGWWTRKTYPGRGFQTQRLGPRRFPVTLSKKRPKERQIRVFCEHKPSYRRGFLKVQD